jgi:hypothetical protein
LLRSFFLESAMDLVCTPNGWLSSQYLQYVGSWDVSDLCLLWNLFLHFHDLHVVQNDALQSGVLCCFDLHLVHVVLSVLLPLLYARVDRLILSLSLHANDCTSRNFSKWFHNGGSLLGIFNQSSLAMSVKSGIQCSHTISSLVILWPILFSSRFVL